MTLPAWGKEGEGNPLLCFGISAPSICEVLAAAKPLGCRVDMVKVKVEVNVQVRVRVTLRVRVRIRVRVRVRVTS